MSPKTSNNGSGATRKCNNQLEGNASMWECAEQGWCASTNLGAKGGFELSKLWRWPDIYRIYLDTSCEYLLDENRQPRSFDAVAHNSKKQSQDITGNTPILTLQCAQGYGVGTHNRDLHHWHWRTLCHGGSRRAGETLCRCVALPIQVREQHVVDLPPGAEQ